jgi:hypothetical protein
MQMTKAEQFFYDNAGYSYKPGETENEGRIRCAKTLAQFEEAAELAGVEYQWVIDDCADWSWMDEARKEEHEAFGCVATLASTGGQTSLWGIVDPSNEYRRVVQAELAMELV